jgi:hypothetical protein
VSLSQWTLLYFHDHASSVPIPGIATILWQLATSFYCDLIAME